MPHSLDHIRTALAAHYRVERELGHGGMANVYLGEGVKHRRSVADQNSASRNRTVGWLRQLVSRALTIALAGGLCCSAWWGDSESAANLLTASRWSPGGQPAYNDTFVRVSTSTGVIPSRTS